VPLATMLRGTVPAALVWSSSLVAAGATAGAALPMVRGVATAAGIPLVIVATWILLRRRAAARLPSPGQRAGTRLTVDGTSAPADRPSEGCSDLECSARQAAHGAMNRCAG